jgi:hypothetical protein
MKSYPQETPKVFVDYISGVMDDYPHEDYYYIFQKMVNDDVSSDDELAGELFKAQVPVFLIAKLMEVREYFWDFSYSQLLWDNN